MRGSRFSGRSQAQRSRGTRRGQAFHPEARALRSAAGSLDFSRVCAIRSGRRSAHSGFSTTYRRSVGLERPLIWLLKIGGGVVEMSSYPFKTNSG